MRGHETVVTEVPLAELEKILGQRWVERWRGRYPLGIPTYDDEGNLSSIRSDPTLDESEAGKSELLEGYRAEGLEGTAYAATCRCGWEANNPLPTKGAAESDARAHLVSIYGEDA